MLDKFYNIGCYTSLIDDYILFDFIICCIQSLVFLKSEREDILKSLLLDVIGTKKLNNLLFELWTIFLGTSIVFSTNLLTRFTISHNAFDAIVKYTITA